jgi:1,4-dihydroxy-2-naphthoate octaprenyltransferase
MTKNEPGIAQMIRAPFLSSIISPLFFGTLLAVYLNNSFNLFGFVLVMIMGTALHAATNVYNDIYDTKQGTDKVNVHRNEFSGGSGILVNFAHLENKMFGIARVSLIMAGLSTIAMMFFIDQNLWLHLWVLYLLSAFFSKYYTAAPVKLASRGWGEISVWFAFGPMAVLIAAVSQNIGLQTAVFAAMPLTGISTLSILLIGQLIDYDADKQTGKWGIAVRRGTKLTAILYSIVQFILVVNIIFLAIFVIESGWPLLISVVPYIVLLPKIMKVLKQNHAQADKLKPAAGMNVQLHLFFSALLTISMIVVIIL